MVLAGPFIDVVVPDQPGDIAKFETLVDRLGGPGEIQQG
jgi:hypothetical protein